LTRDVQAPGKDFCQLAAALVRQVQHGNDRQREGARQLAENTQQRLNAAGGSADDDSFDPANRGVWRVAHDFR